MAARMPAHLAQGLNGQVLPAVAHLRLRHLVTACAPAFPACGRAGGGAWMTGAAFEGAPLSFQSHRHLH
eukprot:CAMPEP_0168429124 /NCGR_PEP_ID=MMETSP0228-20121227/37210_1 /TAXON_ID=133427 /ORGANISM="Protoceratium reticulatum, Strain CCCM 535 (=CCMP 1889)" /LENGTH=68 /DNA_ID=CAMNT_0008443203 /DNA_START=20 /DNA_END=223 /DNA_ORIENTATION=+